MLIESLARLLSAGIDPIAYAKILAVRDIFPLALRLINLTVSRPPCPGKR